MPSKYGDYCSVDGCMNAHHSRGLCHTHYSYRRVHGLLAPLVVEKRYCSEEGCNEIHFALDLCKMHYDRFDYQRRMSKDTWREPTYPPLLVAYLEDRRARNIPPEGVLMEGEAA